MNVMEQILEKIKQYDRIMIFRHIRNDGDCVGASKGLKRILQQSFPEKEILLIDSECAQYLAFMGPEDEDVADEKYAEALGIVVDTASEARISNKKYALCKEIIKIDHHIPLENYGVLAWVEEEMSSCCEMIVKFYDTFRDQLTLDSTAATYLYTGMVTDTGRFRYSEVNGDTLRHGAILLDVGVDTETLFARPGTAYIYLIYGMYHCLNFVTEPEGEPCAVLIRGAVPIKNADIIAENRFGRKYEDLTTHQRSQFLNGPGKLCMGLALTRMQNGFDLLGDELFLSPGTQPSPDQIRVGKRIGIDYAQEAVDFPWRFWLEE